MNELLKDNGYTLDRYHWGFKVSKNPSRKIILSALSVIAGLVLAYFAIQAGSWKLGLLSIMLIAIPFTSHSLNRVLSVTFNTATNRVTVEGTRKQKVIDFSHSPELIVDYHARSAFVSPFEEGNQEHYYNFRVRLSGEKKKVDLFQLSSRRRMDKKVQEVFDELSTSMALWSK